MLGLRERPRLDDADDVADRRPCSASSCAWSLRVRRTTFLYFGWRFVTSTLTTIVLSPLSETTTPRRSWRRPSSRLRLRRCATIGLRVAGVSRAGFECLWRSARGRRLRASSARRRLRGCRRSARQRLGSGLRRRLGSAAGSAVGSRSSGSSAAGSRLGLGCGLLGAGLGAASALGSSLRLRRGSSLGLGLVDLGRLGLGVGLVSRPGSLRLPSRSQSLLPWRASRAGRSGCVRSRAGRACSRVVSSSAPVADWKRRLNSSLPRVGEPRRRAPRRSGRAGP